MSELGLTTAQAQERLRSDGYNLIDRKRRVSALRIFVSQFFSPLIFLLLLAAGLTFLTHEYIDMAVVLAAVTLNVVLGFFQEYKAQNALHALSQLLTPQATVLRDGKWQSVSVKEIVVGDVVDIEAGQRIPADGILIESHQASFDEAILTGESLPVRKHGHTKNLDQAEIVEPQHADSEHYGYMGTLCVSGKAQMKVLATGRATQMGAIAAQLKEVKESATPLQEKIQKFSQVLGVIVISLAGLVFVQGVWSGKSAVEMMTLSTAIAVAAVPEGLSISLTVILAIGMQRILRRKALVRKLVAAETLGSVSVICTDKTGTLTKGKLELVLVKSTKLDRMRQVGLLLKNPQDQLESVIQSWANELEGAAEPTLMDEIAFTSERKYSLKLTRERLFMVGAPEVVLQHCPEEQAAEILPQLHAYASKGYRLVGVASRKNSGKTELKEKVEGELKWVGCFIFSDPVRKDIKNAFQLIREAGVQVKVITGDHALTAQAVMEEAGLPVKESEILLGKDLRNLSEQELSQRIASTKLFARTSPDQKLLIVKALQRLGEVVAMTGDGVNDAPALQQADIGVVVSEASEVSKETADIVLLDNNFQTIVAAIEEGRAMFDNLRKVILFLLANAFTETIVVMSSFFFGWSLPITALQILWVNLITDSLPSMALTIEPKEEDVLKRPPLPRRTPLLTGKMSILMAEISIGTAVIILLIFASLIQTHPLMYVQTMAFTLLVVISLLYIFSTRNLYQPLWKVGLGRNWLLIGAVLLGFCFQLAVIYWQPLQTVFGTVALQLKDWGVIAVAAVVMVASIEVLKVLMFKRSMGDHD